MEFEYTNIISYANIAEIRRYERRPMGGRGSRAVPNINGVPHISDGGKDISGQAKPEKIRSEANARGAIVSFRRLVAANLIGPDNPVLITLTYKHNQTDIDQARKDFNAFARRTQNKIAGKSRYIVVAEFQERGAIHFHALWWGISANYVREERHTRLVASLWGKGFVDIIETDGNQKIATYLSNYFKGVFLDQRLKGRKAYIASKTVFRPIYIRDAILAPYVMGYSRPDLSTGGIAEELEYDTQWLGRCLYKKQIIKPEYV